MAGAANTSRNAAVKIGHGSSGQARSPDIHALQHFAFLASTLLFWSVLIGPRPLLRAGNGVLYLLTTAMRTALLGALLTLSSTLWYSVYLATSWKWGLLALEDQQLGGLIMLFPPALCSSRLGYRPSRLLGPDGPATEAQGRGNPMTPGQRLLLLSCFLLALAGCLDGGGQAASAQHAQQQAGAPWDSPCVRPATIFRVSPAQTSMLVSEQDGRDIEVGGHATIAGVLLAFAIPFSPKQDNAHSPSHRMEHLLHKPVAFFILPLLSSPIFYFHLVGARNGLGRMAVTRRTTIGGNQGKKLPPRTEVMKKES